MPLVDVFSPARTAPLLFLTSLRVVPQVFPCHMRLLKYLLPANYYFARIGTSSPWQQVAARPSTSREASVSMVSKNFVTALLEFSQPKFGGK